VAGLKHAAVAGNIFPAALPLACHPEPIRRGWVNDLNFHMTDQQVYSGMWPTPPTVTCAWCLRRPGRGSWGSWLCFFLFILLPPAPFSPPYCRSPLNFPHSLLIT